MVGAPSRMKDASLQNRAGGLLDPWGYPPITWECIVESCMNQEPIAPREGRRRPGRRNVGVEGQKRSGRMLSTELQVSAAGAVLCVSSTTMTSSHIRCAFSDRSLLPCYSNQVIVIHGPTLACNLLSTSSSEVAGNCSVQHDRLPLAGSI